MTRSAITRPLIALRVLIEDQAVDAAADRMITPTYAMRDAYGITEEPTTAREVAKVAHDDLVYTAARYLSPTLSIARSCLTRDLGGRGARG
ncbi:hypothetical protein [Streptomyces sp. NPDC050856]|uniref:hypothetical protein n=1 Tax=Streptomyces sp. NPDC050856 TaxID=3154939 RepID=UPI0033F44165